MKFFSFLVLILIVSCTHLPEKKSDKLSILQGITNSREVEFNVLAEKGRSVQFELRNETGEILTPIESKIITRNFSDYAIHKILFHRDQQQDYNLFVFEGEKVIDQRLIGRGQKEEAGLKLAVASCLSDFYPQHFKIWETLASTKPEYLLLIGDNVYANMSDLKTKVDSDPELIWKRNVASRLSLPLYFMEKLIPTHAIWDDNDYGMNDGTSSFKYKNESLDIFTSFYAQDLSEENWTKSFGAGGVLSLGNFNLYFLDARSFRSPTKEGSHLGVDQSAWLYSKLKEEETPSLLIKGDQFFGAYHPFDSFEGRHPYDFQFFINELKKLNTPFVFISGDRHMSEIMQFPRGLFGKPGFEITSSPLHARTYADQSINPWRVVSVSSRVNFMIIDNLARDNHWFMDVTNFDENGQINFRRELAVYIRDLQDNLKEIRKRRSGKRRYRKIRTKRSRR